MNNFYIIIRKNIILFLEYFYKLLFIYIICTDVYASEEYSIYFLGIPIIEVVMDNNLNELVFQTESKGILNSFWSINNNYITKYDSLTYGIRTYSKSIQQGNYNGKLDCNYIYDELILKCNQQYIEVNESIQNIFTLLAQLSHQTVEYLDARWFPMNHEGMNYKARFLHVGKEKIEVDSINILCDHFRLDLVKINSTLSQLSPWDYFTDNIASEDASRQLWVESGVGKRKIIMARVSLNGMAMTAKIDNY